ncbi:MAG: Hsp20/alpha crystallin family protein [Pseudomonadota bacterium]|nr:Hsp20/alpha crystallin family protein [Pseudomonadota bacterium]
MRLLIPTSRNGEMSMFEPFRRQFEDMLSDFGRWPAMDWPAKDDLAALDVAETKDAIEIALEAPGMNENEVSVALEGHALVISGEKKSESENQDKAWRVVERSYGAFRRVVPLTFAPDPAKITAAFDKGVLRVSVGKPAELVAQKVTIPVSKAH